jgi:hypothetical protein
MIFTLKDTLSSHIDLIQVRFKKTYILDKKPKSEKNDKSVADQLF